MKNEINNDEKSKVRILTEQELKEVSGGGHDGGPSAPGGPCGGGQGCRPN